MTMRDDDRKRWLDALIERLKKCTPGATYPLDPVERELILEALQRHGQSGEGK